METNKGFTKINNDILNWEWYTDVNTKVLYFHLLLRANFEVKNWKSIVIERGQTVISPEGLAYETGLTISKIRTALGKLERTNYIIKQSTNKYTMLTLLKYDAHTCKDIVIDKQSTSQNSNQIAITKESKDNKIKKIKDIESINKIPLSNFLKFSFPEKYLELENEFKTKIHNYDDCLAKYYDTKQQYQINISSLKWWFKSWIENQPNNNKSKVLINNNEWINTDPSNFF
ncbi:hypothetical protein H4V97_002178 [Flavobacterium sp. CG_23.5]|uniref:hypothetical protein n=1 Tax=Flavobacterium sp. CG_23.5 TaxID=2760708 RepID=UPI001AE5C9E7|nr:hypothetical protein [Flavobacterium sp. CG_23.5]MBP2283860.1 hypothetical protein [Flavobacterium sp. CG_23.5]